MKITGHIFRIKTGHGYKDARYHTDDRVKFIRVNMVRHCHGLTYDLLDINLKKIGTGTAFCTRDLSYRINPNWR